MNSAEQAKKIQKIIAKAWADEAFKQRLLANPSEILREEGIEAPNDVEIRVVESTANLHYFVLPPKPGTVSMSVEAVEERKAAMSSA